MFLYTKWTSLPISTRHEIANKFGIPKVRSTHVSNDRIADDGYDIQAIDSSLNLEAIRAFLDSDEDNVDILWDMFIDRIEGRDIASTPVIEPEPVLTVLPTEEQKQFNKEFEERTGKEAPRDEVTLVNPDGQKINAEVISEDPLTVTLKNKKVTKSKKK